MADRYSAKIGEAFTLDAKFELDGDPYDPFEIERVDLLDDDLGVVESISTVVQVAAGHFRVTVPALTVGGRFCDNWYFTAVEDGEAESVVFEVQVAEVEAEAGEEAPAEESVPALGTDKLCLVTATFYDAGGVPVQGVLVRFSPTILAEQNSPFGFIAREVTAQSDADGELAMYLVRGMTGTVSVTGVAIVRQVEVPDVGTAGLFDLISASQDPLEVQNLDSFVQLPRSS